MQPDGSLKLVDGPPKVAEINLALQQIIAAGGRVWGDSRGLVVADKDGNIVGLFGDLGGLEFDDETIPEGTTGILAINGFFSGTLAAGTVKAKDIDVTTLSAIAADLGIVTAGRIQTPDGKMAFGQEALGEGKHGLLVTDGQTDRIAIGDLSGREWQGKSIPQGTYGIIIYDGFFNGELSQGVINVIRHEVGTFGYGDGSDGDFDSTGDVILPVDTDEGPVVKQYTSFRLNAGHTMTTENPCRGLIILCQGDVIIDGHLHMDGKAGRAPLDLDGEPWEDYAHVTYIQNRSQMLVTKLISLAGRGGAGGKGGNGNGTTWATGMPGGAGGQSGAFGGGSGGGGGGAGAGYNSTPGVPGQARNVAGPNGGGGAGNGGNGGRGAFISGLPPTAGGDGGIGWGSGGSGQNPGEPGGGGGILVIIAKGDVIVGQSGRISANGVGKGGDGGEGRQQGDGYTGGGGGGGGCGGGVVFVKAGGQWINNGVVEASGSPGGAGGSSGGPGAQPGSPGQPGEPGTVIAGSF